MYTVTVWTLIVGVLSRCVLGCCSCVQLVIIWFFFGVTAVTPFTFRQRHWVNIFHQPCFEWLFSMAVRSSQLWSIAVYEHKQFHKRPVADPGFANGGRQGRALKARGSRRRVAERRRREYRVAEGAGEGGGVSLPNREGIWRGAMRKFWVWKWRLLEYSGRYSCSSLFILPWTV